MKLDKEDLEILDSIYTKYKNGDPTKYQEDYHDWLLGNDLLELGYNNTISFSDFGKFVYFTEKYRQMQGKE